MCRRLLVAVLLAGAAPLAAQRASEALAQTAHAADSVLRLWSEAEANAVIAEEAAHRMRPAALDTVRAGGLVVIANPSTLPLAEGAALAWRVLDSTFGSAAQKLAATPIELVALGRDTAAHRALEGRRGTRLPAELSAGELAARLLALAPLPQPPKEFADWLGRAVPSVGHPNGGEAAYVEWVTSPFAVARACRAGDLEACRLALELPGPGAGLASPGERRSAVRQLRSLFTDEQRGNPARYDQCEAGDDAACRGLLATAPAVLVPRPLGSEARLELVWVALRLGGREGYARLIDSPAASPAERLARAAGVPDDSLLSAWWHRVHAARPTRVTVTPLGVLAGLGWSGLLAAVALRSSRWRGM
jgi:hypothetical protein